MYTKPKAKEDEQYFALKEMLKEISKEGYIQRPIG